MQSTVIAIPTNKIVDWESFHTVFAETLGFPGYYGRNMDAWIDCLTYADSNMAMTSISVNPDELLILRLDEAADFLVRCPEQYSALIRCTAFVNYRRIEVGDEPVVALILGGDYPNL